MSTSTARSAPAATPPEGRALAPSVMQPNVQAPSIMQTSAPTPVVILSGARQRGVEESRVSTRTAVLRRAAAMARRTRLFLSTIVFGAEAARPLDSRDVTAYLRTTDG